jgi:DNA-directed RNA polymerase subunit M/transcription elongation factor TFIIS
MKFCPDCNNMFFINIDPTDESRITYYCRKCNHIDRSAVDNCRVMDVVSQINTDASKYMASPLIKYDPTLKLSNTLCPNRECASNADAKAPAERQVVYIRCNEQTMKSMYVCCVCDHSWKMEVSDA